MGCFLSTSIEVAFHDVLDYYAKGLDYVRSNSTSATKRAVATALRAQTAWNAVRLPSACAAAILACDEHAILKQQLNIPVTLCRLEPRFVGR